MTNAWEGIRKNQAADRSLPSSETNGRPIAMKLAVAFGILVAILIGIGILGLSRMDQINAHLEDVLVRHWAKLQLAREALMYSNHNSRITMEIFLVDDQPLIDPLLAERAENTKEEFFPLQGQAQLALQGQPFHRPDVH